MAASVTAVHSILTNKSHPFRQSFPSATLPRRTLSLHIRCMADENPDMVKTPVTPTTTPISSSPPPPPPRKPRVSTEFNDVLAFGGPAPERINGRLAMVGFVAALAVEVANGQDLFSQISEGGVGWFVGTSVVLSLASLVPLFKGVTVQSKSEPVMSSDAEMWNGRMAMLGLVALAVTEYVKGGALV